MFQPSSRPGNVPRTDIDLSLGELELEIDLTLIDRIHAIITPEIIIQPGPLAGASMYHTVGVSWNLDDSRSLGTATLPEVFDSLKFLIVNNLEKFIF